MHVIFGQELEGCPLPKSTHGLQKIVVGPLGLLDLLEMRLGIAPHFPNQLVRIAAYKDSLASAIENGELRFFNDSFQLDPLGSAKVILRWRDELRLAGWDSNLKSQPNRLADLAAVDVIFQSTAEGKADTASRLEKIRFSLGAGESTGITQLDLVDPIRAFPTAWRRVIESLPQSENTWPIPDEPLAEKGTVLHNVQAALLCQTTKMSAPDDSVRIVQSNVISHNATAAAQAIDRLDAHPSALLIGKKSSLQPVDDALRKLNSPVSGSRSDSAAMPLTQLVAAALRLHWGPFNPEAWLEFFLCPVSPINRRLSRKMARAVANTPSRLNPKWQETIDQTLESIEDARILKRVKKQIQTWFSPRDFSEKAAGTVLSETCRNLSRWMNKRAIRVELESHRNSYRSIAHAILDLAELFERTDEIDRATFDRTLAEWLNATNAQIESCSPELGAAPHVDNPAHVLEPVDHVFWWQPEDPTTHRIPWNLNERKWLEENELVFPDEIAVRNATRENQLRPILFAQKSILLFASASLSSENQALPAILVRLLAQCDSAVSVQAVGLIETASINRNPLARKRREWNLSRTDLLTPRDSESFSSLNKFIYSPWDWVLTYQTKLRQGDLVDLRVMDDAATRGGLLHGFVESLLEPATDPLEVDERNIPATGSADDSTGGAASLLETLIQQIFGKDSDFDWASVTEDAVKNWVTNQWDDVLTIHAAHYLVPGFEASRSELLYLAKNGIWKLIVQLREAGVIHVTCEEHISEIPFQTSHLAGFIDLKVENTAGEIGVIDLKLGGLTGRREELKKGRFLQLATYGKLVYEQHGQSPHLAYFIFSSGGTLIANSNEFFTGAEIVGADPGWQTCWAEFESLWNQRRTELEQGRLEVTLSNFYPRMLLPHWTLREPDKYSNFLNLVGWDVGA